MKTIQVLRNGGDIQYLRLGALHVWTRQRSARLATEVHNYRDTRFASITVGHPHRHARWAFYAILYLPTWWPIWRRNNMRTVIR
jgi:hypothetical protein